MTKRRIPRVKDNGSTIATGLVEFSPDHRRIGNGPHVFQHYIRLLNGVVGTDGVVDCRARLLDEKAVGHVHCDEYSVKPSLKRVQERAAIGLEGRRRPQ